MPNSLAVSTLCLLVLVASGQDAASEAAEVQWTGWLGPERNGWVEGFEPPAEWPGELQQVWQVEVGTGYGSPLVAEGRIYQHARQGEEEVVWCLDLESGETIWRKSYPAPFKMGGGGERHGKGPKSCPVLAGERFFTYSISGELSAWNAASGELLWQRNFRDRFGITHPYWGASASPVADGSRVVVHLGGDKRGALTALDGATGEFVWSQGDAPASYSSPLVVEINGVRQVIDWNQEALIGVESESGTLLWEFPAPQIKTDQNMPTPVYHHGLVILGGENRGIRGLRPKLRDGEWSVREVWFQKEVALDMSTAVVNEGRLYGFSHYGKGRLFCLDLRTGDVLWQGPGRTGENVTFLSLPGYVLALLNNGQVQILTADGPSTRTAATYRVSNEQTWAPPVLVPDGLLVKDHQHLTRWRFSAP